MKYNPIPHNRRKATSQTIWIVIAIIIALATAMIILLLMNSTTGKAKTGAGNTMDSAGNTLKREMCANACDTCKRIYKDCISQWSEISKNNGCDAPNVKYVCT